MNITEKHELEAIARIRGKKVAVLARSVEELDPATGNFQENATACLVDLTKAVSEYKEAVSWLKMGDAKGKKK